VSWGNWPKERSLNPAQDAQAVGERLANGSLTFAEVWGADWKKYLAEIGEGVKFARDNGFFPKPYNDGLPTRPGNNNGGE